MPTVVKMLETTKPTATKSIALLEVLGILEETTGRKRDRTYRGVAMVIDWAKVDEWEVLDRLHASGWISDPATNARSIVLSDEAVERSRVLFAKHFGVAEEKPTKRSRR